MVYVDSAPYPPEEQTEIKIGIARKLATRSPAATTSALAFAFFSSIILSFQVPVRDVIVWLAAVVAVAALPPLYLYVQAKHPFSVENIDRYLFANTLSALGFGTDLGHRNGRCSPIRNPLFP